MWYCCHYAIGFCVILHKLWNVFQVTPYIHFTYIISYTKEDQYILIPYGDWCLISLVCSGKFQGTTTTWGLLASFHIPSNSLFSAILPCSVVCSEQQKASAISFLPGPLCSLCTHAPVWPWHWWQCNLDRWPAPYGSCEISIASVSAYLCVYIGNGWRVMMME